MARLRSPASLAAAVTILCAFFTTTMAATETVYITGQDKDGNTKELAVNRRPGLYTGDFGDCLGGQSLFNITKFDAAYYADNMTVQFHLDGTTNIRNESLMSMFRANAREFVLMLIVIQCISMSKLVSLIQLGTNLKKKDGVC